MKTKKQGKIDVSEVEMHKIKSCYCILEVLKQEEMFGLRFWSLNDKENVMTNAFSSYKLRRKLCVVYIEVKLQQGWCTCCI